MFFRPFVSWAGRVYSAPDSRTSTTEKRSNPASLSNTTAWIRRNKFTIAIIFSIILLFSIAIILIYMLKERKYRKKEQERPKETKSLEIEIIKDKIEEDTITLDEAVRPPSSMQFVEPVSVWESDDDESGSTMAKRTRHFLKGLKEKGKRKTNASGDCGSVIGWAKESRVSKDGFEDTAWGREHTPPHGIRS